MFRSMLMQSIDWVLWHWFREEAEQAYACRPFYRHHPGAPLSVLFAGDSLVVGVGATHPRFTVAGRLAADCPYAHVENVGRVGARVEHLRTMFANVEGSTYDVAIIQIGGNDIAHFTELSNMERDLRAALTIAKRLAPHVILMSYGDVGRSPRFRWPLTMLYSERSREARKIFKRVAYEHDVHFIDLLKRRYDPTLNPKKYIAADGIHVNDAGYALFYSALRKQLRRIGILASPKLHRSMHWSYS